LRNALHCPSLTLLNQQSYLSYIWIRKVQSLTPSPQYLQSIHFYNDNMRDLLLLLAIGATICSAAVLPPLHSKSLRQRSALRELYQSKKQAARRSVQSCGITVPLSLVDSGFCGNISIGSQSEPVLTLFDLRASQLSALSPDLEFCSSSGDCSPVNSNINSYNPNHSDSATNLTETFVITVSNSTFSGVLYEDSVVLGGIFTLVYFF